MAGLILTEVNMFPSERFNNYNFRCVTVRLSKKQVDAIAAKEAEAKLIVDAAIKRMMQP